MLSGGTRTKNIQKTSRSNKPLITVVTVVYNGKETLEETVLSVLNQSYDNIEYIIVDGGSIDGTLDIIKKYEEKIDYWISESDKGVYDAMNKGIDLTTGEWINFMNSGDCFFDNYVLSNINFSAICQDKKFIYSDFYMKSKFLDLDNIFCFAEYDKGEILHQSVIYKKELHKKYGYYIVTKKIIVSDYLFFNAIDSEYVQKLDIPISINAQGGISSNSWCGKQKICVDYIYGRKSFMGVFLSLCYLYFKLIMKKLLSERAIHCIKKIKKLGK